MASRAPRPSRLWRVHGEHARRPALPPTRKRKRERGAPRLPHSPLGWSTDQAGLLAVVVSACRPLVHPVLGPRLGLGPIREMLRAPPAVLRWRGSPGVLGAMQVAAPRLPVLREQALQLVVARLAGHPSVSHASLLVDRPRAAPHPTDGQAASPLRGCGATRPVL